ncbi:MAG: hypothetical protein Q8P73_04070 [bacterium]|nr:hypothetical protein [bacterium]
MDNNYWYYTLSAVPQTLAAMIALAATFSVFKLDHVSRRIDDVRLDLRRFILLATSKFDKDNEIHEIERLNHREFLALYEKGLETLNSKDDYLGLGQQMFGKYAAEMKRIIQSEWHSFYSPKPFRIMGYLEMKRDIFKNLLSARNESLSALLRSLSLTVFVIVVSLIVLPNFNFFSGSLVVIYAVVVGAVISLAVTAVSVWKISQI